MVAADRVVEQLRAHDCSARRDRPGTGCPSPAAGPAPELPPYPRRQPPGPRRARGRLPVGLRAGRAALPRRPLPARRRRRLRRGHVEPAGAHRPHPRAARVHRRCSQSSRSLLTRKDLRGAAETFWLVVAGMLTVDLLGGPVGRARRPGRAGLARHRRAGRRRPAGAGHRRRRVGPRPARRPAVRRRGRSPWSARCRLLEQRLAAPRTPPSARTIAIPLLAGAVRAPARARAAGRRTAVGGLAWLSWLVLLGLGWDRALETAGLGDVVVRPARLAARWSPPCSPPWSCTCPAVPDAARPVAAGLALFAAGAAGQRRRPRSAPRPATCSSARAVLLVLGLVAAFAPAGLGPGRRRARRARRARLGVVARRRPLGRRCRRSTPTASTRRRPRPWPAEDDAAPWMDLRAGRAQLVAATLALPAASRPGGAPRSPTRCVGALAPAVLALGGLVLVLELEPPLWAASWPPRSRPPSPAGAAWWSRDTTVAGRRRQPAPRRTSRSSRCRTASANDLLLALRSSRPRWPGPGHGRRTPRARPAATSPRRSPVPWPRSLGGWALVAWGCVLEADDDGTRRSRWRCTPRLVGVLAAPLTRRTHLAGRLRGRRRRCSAVVAAAYSSRRRASAMALTIVGSAICLVAVDQPRPRRVRLARRRRARARDGARGSSRRCRLPSSTPFPPPRCWSPPGAWRLRTDPEAQQLRGPGQRPDAALLPSLLLALDEPVSLRGALIGAAGVLVLGAGVQQRLAAPFVLGAVTTGLLALRHLEPYADAVPRWISLGAVGLALLARRRHLGGPPPQPGDRRSLPGRPALEAGRHNGGMTTPSSATSTTRSAAARRSAGSSSASTRGSPPTRCSARCTPRRTSPRPRTGSRCSSSSTGAARRRTPTGAATRGCGCGTPRSP